MTAKPPADPANDRRKLSIDDCLELVRPRPRRNDVQFWTLLGVLPFFVLALRFGFGFSAMAALGAGVAAWLPLGLLWWNRYAVQEQQRLERATSTFDGLFPVKGIGRPQALQALVDLAREPAADYHAEAHLLLDELGEAGRLEPAPYAPPASSGKVVAPDLSGSGPSSPATAQAVKPAVIAPGVEPVLPPELQQAVDAQPSLESAPAPAPAEPVPDPPPATAASEGAPPSEPQRYDYIPLEPHDDSRKDGS